MLVSDPQIKPPKGVHDESWLFDSSMRRGWRAAKRLHPDIVIFLGDMLSAGKYVRSEKECVYRVDVCYTC